MTKLTRRYGDRTAVDGVSFHVGKGEIVGFLGPNGAGKTTTLRMITGFLAPTEGTIRVDGIDAVADPIGAKRKVGYMPEAAPLYPEMRVHEYLEYRGRLKGVPRKQLAARVDAALEMATVADVRRRIIGQLSKGYRQRVGLADALVADPPLLILDEPTAGLDPNQIRQVRDLIRKLSESKTILLSTHILPEVEATCSRVVIIHRGKVVGEGRPDALRSPGRAAEMLVAECVGDPESFRDIFAAVEGTAKVIDVVPIPSAAGGEPVSRFHVEFDGSADYPDRVFRAVAAAGKVVRSMSREVKRLEDVFAELTTVDVAAEPVPVVEAPPEDAPTAGPPASGGAP